MQLLLRQDSIALDLWKRARDAVRRYDVDMSRSAHQLKNLRK